MLSMAGFEFDVLPADVDETADPALSPEELVAVLSEKKALHVRGILASDGTSSVDNSTDKTDAVIIGADTVVAIDGLILGKPKDEEDAFRMLKQLQGRKHVVYTGVTIACSGESVACTGESADFESNHYTSVKTKTFVEFTSVHMRTLSDKAIRDYIATGEPMDKAGAYGIQERGAVLIERVEGDYFTVVGLPLCQLNKVMEEIKL